MDQKYLEKIPMGSKTYGPKPESFQLDDGERYYVGK
jgi:hypothetical protein